MMPFYGGIQQQLEFVALSLPPKGYGCLKLPLKTGKLQIGNKLRVSFQSESSVSGTELRIPSGRVLSFIMRICQKRTRPHKIMHIHEYTLYETITRIILSYNNLYSALQYRKEINSDSATRVRVQFQGQSLTAHACEYAL